MLDLTIKGYVKLIEGLSIHDLIIYYFTLYFFVVLIEKALGIKIETEGKIKTNPKVLITLILIFSFQFVHAKFTVIAGGASTQTLLFSGFIFITILFLFKSLIFSEYSMLRYLYLPFINKAAGNQFEDSKLHLAKEIEKLENNKAMTIENGQLSKADFSPHIDDLIANQTYEINTSDILSQAAIKYVINSKDTIVLLLIDVYISAVLIYFSFKLNWILCLLCLTFSIIFLFDKCNSFINGLNKIPSSRQDVFLRKKDRRYD